MSLTSFGHILLVNAGKIPIAFLNECWEPLPLSTTHLVN